MLIRAARTLLRVQYEIVRAPMSFLDEAVLPVVFDDGAPARLACEPVDGVGGRTGRTS